MQILLKNINFIFFFLYLIMLSPEVLYSKYFHALEEMWNECVCVLCFHFVFLRESLIRTAFQCLQLVVTDFLPTMPCTCLQIVVEVAGSFGLHNQELNISLTSIGLLVSFLLTYSDAASGFHFCFSFFMKTFL